MRLINNRYYFDYNATSPLADSVIEFLSKGDFLFGNPSSAHSTGKRSDSFVRNSRKQILKIFGLDDSFKLFFHSGATEGINTLIKGFAQKRLLAQQKICFFYSETDHLVMTNIARELELSGHKKRVIKIDKMGQFDLDLLIKEINEEMSSGYIPLLNFTQVNNETGIVWPLSLAEKIKEQTGIAIHLDSAQVPGKIDRWNELSNKLDAYTFSAHKFGGLKSVGFSFYKKDFSFCPLLHGGGQEEGVRSGTLNSLGIYSAELALEQLRRSFNSEEQFIAKNYIENKLMELLGSNGEIVGRAANFRNLNTINFLLYNKKADTVTTAFDLAGIDVSSGPACKAGQLTPSRVLLAMGYAEDLASNSIRLSFSSNLLLDDATNYWNQIQKVLVKLI